MQISLRQGGLAFSVTSYELPASSYQLPVTSFELPASSFQLRVSSSQFFLEALLAMGRRLLRSIKEIRRCRTSKSFRYGKKLIDSYFRRTQKVHTSHARSNSASRRRFGVR